mmetsp:Transcript_8996/g.30952  ORF Transcript_8996/g.30952 Transcript_8996/m.30952 type:complete len:221 (-) Transcript_8996:477-1139(-)
MAAQGLGPCRSFLTSPLDGMEGTAPTPETAIAPAAAARRRHSSELRPSRIATAKAARAASPAAVASTTTPPGGGKASCHITLPPSSTSTIPRPPKVTKTLLAPLRCSALAASTTPSSVSVLMPSAEILRSSLSLGAMKAASLNTSSSIGESRPTKQDRNPRQRRGAQNDQVDALWHFALEHHKRGLAYDGGQVSLGSVGAPPVPVRALHHDRRRGALGVE